MTLVESEAAFASRCRALGIDAGEVAALKVRELATFGSFAWLVPCSGGQVDEALFKEALTQALGSEPTLLTMPKFRRLHFESYSLFLADTKAKVDRTEDSQPRKLPMPERAQRHEAQAKSLAPGVLITDWNEPSFALLDSVQQQFEEAQLRYVPVESCTCRIQELAGTKKETFTMSDKSGFIKIGERDPELRIECGQDMFRIRQALLRRSLAYDQAGIIRFPTMEFWHSYLFEALQREAPPGHKKISLNQILLADRQLFTRMIETCRHGLSDTGSGSLPADVAMKTLQYDVRITTFLLPLPGSAGGSSGSGDGGAAKVQLPVQARTVSRADYSSWKDFKAAKKSVSVPYTPSSGKGGKGKGKSAGKSKGKSKGGKSQRPPGLEGTWTTSNGVRMCDAYNMGNCSEAGATAPGSSCAKGLHVCCKPWCGEAHPLHQCSKP